MKVLFETDRFNDPNIDSKLIDILLLIKAELLKTVEPLKKEIEEVGGELIIVFTPTDGGFRAIGMNPDLIIKISRLTDKIVFKNLAQQIISVNKN